MTSAPISASSIVHTGPDKILERSTTKRPSNGFMIPRNFSNQGLTASCLSLMYFLPTRQKPKRKAYQLSWRRKEGFSTGVFVLKKNPWKVQQTDSFRWSC